MYVSVQKASHAPFYPFYLLIRMLFGTAYKISDKGVSDFLQ